METEKEKHMQSIFSLLYLLFILGVSVTTLFIVYHITKYSLSKQHAFLGTTVFMIGTVVLLWINSMIFLRIDWSAVTFEPQMTQKNLW